MYDELKKILRPLFWQIAWAVLAGTAASASAVGLMGLSAWLIASAALQPPLYTLSLAILGVRFCGIMRAVFRYLDRYLTHQAGFALFGNFRTVMLKYIIAALPFRVHTSGGSAFDIIVNACDTLRDSVLRFALPPVTAFILTWLTALWLNFYNFYLAALLLSAWLFLAVLMPLIAWRFYKRCRREADELSQDVMDMYEGRAEMNFYGFAPHCIDKAELSIENYQQRTAVLFKLKSRIEAVSECIMSVFFCLLLAVLIYDVSAGLNAVFAICIMLTVQAVFELLAALPPLTEQLAQAAHSWQQLRAYCTKSLHFAQLQHDNIAEMEQIEDNAAFRAEHICCGYGVNTICRDISFSLHRGSKTLLLGSSGCGKSTLLYAMTRLLPLSSGSMYINGKNYNSLDDESVRSHFAVSFQTQHIFHMSLRDNFKMIFPDINDAEIIASLRRAGLMQFAASEKLDFMLESGGANLSGGQLHRLQLAICTARQREIILLDEPTAGLDIHSARTFLNCMTDLAQEAAMLVISHDLSIVDYFDDVIIMDNGRLVEQGKIKNLLKNKNTVLFKLLDYDNLL